MMDPIRRTILTTGAAATAMAAAPRAFAQQTGQGGAAMSFFEKGAVRIHYEEAGSGYPLLLIAGGGLNSTISGLSGSYPPFDSFVEFKGEYRCIAADLRNANAGQSSGPLEIERPWDSHTDDHLGIDKFMVMGFCIGGPLIWNLLRRAPDRVVAAVLAQPSGSRPEMRDLFYDNNLKGWAPELVKRRPDPSDGRRWFVELTAAGDAKLQATRMAREDWLSETLERDLDAGERELLNEAIALLRRIAGT